MTLHQKTLIQKVTRAMLFTINYRHDIFLGSLAIGMDTGNGARVSLSSYKIVRDNPGGQCWYCKCGHEKSFE